MVAEKTRKEIRRVLETQDKESIIDIFLGVLDQQVKEKNELSLMVDFFYGEVMSNLKKIDNLVDEVILLEAIIEDLLGIEDNEDIEEDVEDVTVGRKPKSVLVSHPETGYTDTFPSLQTASETLKVSIGGLSEVANGKRESIKGYLVTFL